MFGFPKADRSEISSYNRNYLRTIIFQVRFEPTEKIIENKGKIIDLYQDLFPRANDSFEKGFHVEIKHDQTPILSPIQEKNQGFELRSQDGQKILAFSKDTISYNISGKSYTNYDMLEKDFELLEQVFTSCEIYQFNRVAIRKINIIDFEITTNQGSVPMDILSMVLNPDLLSNIEYFPSADRIQQNIQTLNFVKDKDRLNLRYGMVVPQLNIKKGQILIDIDLFKLDKVDKNKLINTLESINLEIFNIFNWALSKDALIELKRIR